MAAEGVDAARSEGNREGFGRVFRSHNRGKRAIGIVFAARAGIDSVRDQNRRDACGRAFHDEFHARARWHCQVRLPVNEIRGQTIYVQRHAIDRHQAKRLRRLADIKVAG